MRRTANAAGFSLIELMIAMAVLGVIMAQMFVVLSTQKQAYMSGTRTLDVQESARLVTDLMAYDTRMAGMMVPRFAGVSSVNGSGNDPTKNPDRFCVSDPDIFSIPTSTTDSTFWDGRDTRFTGSTGTPMSGGTITLNTLDVDGDASATDFRVGSGIILSDGAKTFCTAITAINGMQLTLKHSASGIFAGSVTAIPAIVYELTDTAATATLPEQMSLTRNGNELSSVIEDLQVEYWVDKAPPNCNGVMDNDEFPIYDLNQNVAVDLERVRLVRISVVARSELQEDAAGGSNARYKRPQVADRVAGQADGFRRRRFSTSVLPRNLLAQPDPSDTSGCANVP